MSIVKRTGWILVGVIIGAVGSSSLSAVKEQTVPQTVSHAPDSSRLIATLHSTSIGMAAFIKDTKSEGCWIVMSKDSGVSIATAPVSACQ